jgi:hypothetical protein
VAANLYTTNVPRVGLLYFGPEIVKHSKHTWVCLSKDHRYHYDLREAQRCGLKAMTNLPMTSVIS